MALTLVTSDLIGGLDYSKLTGTVPTWNQNTTGTAATVTGASQSNITSLGTLTSLTSSGNITGSRFFSGDGGNKTNPMIANGSDQDTGIFFPAANTMAFTAGDTESFRIAGANATFAGTLTVNGTGNSVINGNIGIGATPTAQRADDRQLQIKDATSLFQLNGINSTYLSYNAYYDGAWKRRISGYVNMFRLGNDNNGISFYQSGTGSANSAITFTEPLSINSAGKVKMSSTRDVARLNVKATGTEVYNGLNVFNSSNEENWIYASHIGTKAVIGDSYLGSSSYKPLVLQTSEQDRLTISTGGNVGIGTTSPSAKLEIVGSAHNQLIIKDSASSIQLGADDSVMIGVTMIESASSMWFAGPHIPGSTGITSSFQFARYTGSWANLVTIASGGNVGIGEPSPNRKLNVASGTNGDGIYLSGLGSAMSTNDYRSLEFAYSDTDTSYGSSIHFEVPNAAAHGGQMSFLTDNTSGTLTKSITIYNDQRVSSVGSVHSGHDGATGSSGAGTSTVGSTLGNSGFITAHRTNATCLYIGTTTTREVMAIYRGTDQAGKIRITGTSTVAFESGSDYRLKEDLKDFNGLDIISKLKVYNFNWIGEDRRDHGLLAHEVQEILPDLVSGKKDGVLESGKIDKQTLDYGRFTPMLIKALQEQQAQIELLKQEVESLKQ